ncbi:MAG: M28 family peptidase [Candidatus Limimorpha sp.]
MKKILVTLLIIGVLSSCGGEKKPMGTHTAEKKKVEIPSFSGDSAYYFVKKQLDFGPRVPGSAAHEQCAEWFVNTLNQWADSVYVQNFRSRLYDGRSIDGKNIIASFNPEANKRVIVASHWDSRPYADNDPDEANWKKPIDGANDGASGCGIIMELARILHSNHLNIGVDLILFDVEDYGTPRWADDKIYSDNSWCLGSQHWSKTPHENAYSANFGILLDMVGASNPRFPKEYYSQRDAVWVLNKVWRTARDMGYDQYFVNELGDPINDDHIYLNQFAGIPTIDIIHLVGDEDRTSSFYPYWHTLNDNLEQIDRKTLQMVGNVVTTVLYSE